MKGSLCFTISVSLLMLQVESAPIDLSPTSLLGSIRNVTLGATSFISNSIQKQTEIILQAKDTATDYVSNMVAGPKQMLNNARHATIDYSKFIHLIPCLFVDAEQSVRKISLHALGFTIWNSIVKPKAYSEIFPTGFSASTKRIVDSTASKGMEFKIRSLIEIFRANMPYGVPVLNLPVLEPLYIEHMDFETQNKNIGNVSSSIDNVTVSQLSTFVVDHVKLTILDGVSLALNLSVPTIQANGIYRVRGKMGKLFAVNGGGPFNLEAHGAKFYVHTVLGYSGTMYVKSVNIDFSIESVNAVFEHLFPNKKVDEVINEVLSGMAPEILEIIKPELRPKVEEMIAQRINATVGSLTMGNLIAILTGTADISNFAHLAIPQLPL